MLWMLREHKTPCEVAVDGKASAGKVRLQHITMEQSWITEMLQSGNMAEACGGRVTQH